MEAAAKVRAHVIAGLLFATLPAACAAALPPPPPPRVWAEATDRIPPNATAFAVGTTETFRMQTGGWTEPLVVSGVVLSAGPRMDPRLPLRLRGWRGQRELVLRSGDRRVVVQYDTPMPADAAQPGDWVELRALAMSDGPRLSFFMAVYDRAGELRFAGLRGSSVDAPLHIPGWSLELGPSVAQVPLCGSSLETRALRVRGPGGEATLWPGFSSIAALGRSGAAYVVDLHVSRSTDARCETAAGRRLVSFVVRRVEP